MKYVALLRGINVGGNNIIKMVALREAFEALGYANVATYIQSGNVVFSVKTTPTAKLTDAIEKSLAKAFSYDSKVVVISAKEIAQVIDEAPPQFGKDPARYRYDVLFVKPPLKAREALPTVAVAPGIDEVFAGAHALYFRRLVAKATKSRLAKIVQNPIYKSLTIRNWNTTLKLHAMTAD